MKIDNALTLFKKRQKVEAVASEPAGIKIDFDLIRKSPVMFCDFRSGSKMLKVNLAAMSPLKSVFEVLDPAADYGKEPDRFNLYRFLRSEDVPPLVDLTRHGERIYLEFLSRFVSQFDAPPIIDLKYSHSFIFGVSSPSGHPAVLRAIASSGCKVIHLVRRNFIKQAISQMVAMKTLEFGSTARFKEILESGKTFWLDPDKVVSMARGKRDIVEHSTRMLDNLDVEYTRVAYEELVGPDALDHHKRVLRHVGCFSDAKQLPKDRAQRQNSEKLVYNIEEILDVAHRKHSDLMYGL